MENSPVMPLNRWGLRCLSFFTFLVFPCAGWTQTAPEFDWQTIPDSAILKPQHPYTSPFFTSLEGKADTYRLLFRWPAESGSIPSSEDQFRFVVVTPRGGIRSATFTADPPRWYLNEAPVEPATPPTESRPSDRLTHRWLGEYRGAELVLVEFRPLMPLAETGGANRSFLPEATLTLALASPLQSSCQTSPQVIQAMESFVLNGKDLSACLPPISATEVLDAQRVAEWRLPTFKIRTRGEGWFAIPIRAVISEIGRRMTPENLRLSRRAPLLPLVPGSPFPAGVPCEDVPEDFFVVSASGEWNDQGSLDPSDILLFHSEASQCPTDPYTCHYLAYWENPPESAPSDPEPMVPQGGSVTTGWVKDMVGEDRQFVEGGSKGETQTGYWVDQPFPANNTPLHLRLPDWVGESVQPAEGTLKVLFGSNAKDRYSPSDRLKFGEMAVMVDGVTLPCQIRTPAGGTGWELAFTLPARVKEPTVTLIHSPKIPPKNPLYFDRAEITGQVPLRWSRNQYSWTWPLPVTGTLVISGNPGSQDDKLLALARTVEGRWKRLALSVEGENLICHCPFPIVELQLPAFHQAPPPSSFSLMTLPAWLDAPVSAGQLLIAPPVFQMEVDLVREANQDMGYSSQWINLEQIFNLFTGGQFSPHAVKAFLAWVVRTWPHPQPWSAVLIGDSSWDAWERHPHHEQVPNWTPSYHTDAEPDFPSDHWFIEGQTGDRIEDWFWGRLPCQSAIQLQHYLGKLRENLRLRETNSSPRFVWVTDDNPPFDRNVDEIFHQTLPLTLRWDHILVKDYPFVDNYYYGPNLARIQEEAKQAHNPLDYGKISLECNKAVREAINKGASLLVYHGHSGLNVLAHERVLFGGGSKFSDVPGLTNGGSSPVAFLMTCDVGRFDYAENPKWSVGLAEELLFHGQGGCLGLFTSTGRGIPSDHMLLLRGLMDALFVSRLQTLGGVVWAGKVQSLIPGSRSQGVDMFTYLGDPLLAPAIPEEREVRAERFRWNRDGSLDCEHQIGSGTPPLNVPSCWRVSEGLAERWTWQLPEVTPDGKLRFTLPEARDTEELLVGITTSVSGELAGRERAARSGVDLRNLLRPDWTALAGQGLPNLTLDEDGLQFENYSPQGGETIFLDATVKNQGLGAAENVSVSALDEESNPLRNFANFKDPVIRRLGPGEQQTVRLRWDQFEGTGERTVTVRVDPKGLIQETSKEDNQAAKKIHILSKADLGWGLVRDSTAGATDFSRARTVPASWVKDPTSANLGPFTPLRHAMNSSDRAALLNVPLCNFGETRSPTITLQFTYTGLGAPGLPEPFTLRVSPLDSSREKIRPRSVPVLLLPGVGQIEILADPDGEMDESTRDNNRLRIVMPKRFWESIPTLKPSRKPPKALERIEVGQ